MKTACMKPASISGKDGRDKVQDIIVFIAVAVMKLELNMENMDTGQTCIFPAT